MDDTKNVIIAVVLSFAVIFGWYMIFPPADTSTQPVAVEQSVASGEAGSTATDAATGTANSAALDIAPASKIASREDALARTDRIVIDTPSVSGSISLKGGRIDDLHLKDYHVDLDKSSDTVTLLSPTGSEHPFLAVYGWLPTAENPVKTPNANTLWSVEGNRELTPETPVTLVWDNGEGLVFRREITIDDKYMFDVVQSVENNTGAEIQLAPYGYVSRRGEPITENFYISHEGAVGMADGVLELEKYSAMQELPAGAHAGQLQKTVAVKDNGWLGFADKYWMAVISPMSVEQFNAVYKYSNTNGRSEYRTEARLPVMTVAAGTTGEMETRLFAGAKEYDTIKGYEDLGIDRFIDTIDWGWFFFLTKPIAQLLLFIEGIIGNMGVSIITLTLIIKALLFPLAYKSYVSMSKMKMLQPEMEKLKETYGDDRQKLQQEMMALYKREKANPAAGCLPILLQIPIFFSLYKVLYVTIEMRHAPFFGWIQDLSAPDPTSWMNLFGVLPFAAPDHASLLGMLGIGIFPIFLGITMWLQQKLNPAPTDATQAQIMAWMPWVFMFMLGKFASGLVIYWCANNIITFTQQYLIMRSQGVDIDLLGNVKASFKRKKKA